MTSLHPEELLDRERLGTLDEEQRTLLDAHCRQCSACALERQARSDFDSDLEPASSDDALLARVIERAATAPPRTLRNRSHKLGLIFVAAALVAATAIAGSLRLRARSEAPAAPPSVETTEVDEPSVIESPTKAPEITTETPEPEPPPATSAQVERIPTASELFASATAARRDKQDESAIRLYRELQRRYPDSREAKASRVVLGQLLLDRTDPNKALAEFDRYLDGGAKGTVTEEALVGRAVALQKLGRSAEERAAWQELLAKFPSSVHAARARERIVATQP